MINSDRKIWITWHNAARSRNMSKFLNLDLKEIFINQNPIFRHVGSTFWTIWILLKSRPKVVFLQLSFLLLLITVLYKLLSLNKVVIVADCHTKALRRKVNGKLNKIFWPLKTFSFSKVDFSIVSNIGMEKDIKKLHSNYFFIPDKIPENKINKIRDTQKIYCVNISSFAVDEPVGELFDLAQLLSKENIKLYWTGKINENLIKDFNKPDNLIFTGYMTFERYYDLIGNASCLIALTTEADTLQSGAYEALSVEVPMVITDSIALKNYFDSAALYTNHNPHDLFEKVKYAIENQKRIICEIQSVKEKRNNEYATLIKELEEQVNNRINEKSI